MRSASALTTHGGCPVTEVTPAGFARALEDAQQAVVEAKAHLDRCKATVKIIKRLDQAARADGRDFGYVKKRLRELCKDDRRALGSNQ